MAKSGAAPCEDDSPLRVVIADDAPAMRALLRELLASTEGWAVVGEATDGAEAVRLASQRQPDVVVIDLAMPVLDGLRAIPLIRRCSPATRIIVLSGFPAERMEGRVLAAGADAYLEKRYRPDDLRARLLEACREPTTPRLPVPRADARFEAVFDHSPIGMSIEALDGRILRVNHQFCVLAGYTEAELLTRTVEAISHPDDAAVMRAEGRDLPATGAATGRAEVRLVRPDGGIVWTRVYRSSLCGGADGQELLTQVVDITDQKRLEINHRIEAEATARYAEELARSNAALAHFASVAAHELRSPLQIISGFAALLQRTEAGSLDERGRDCVHWIVDGAARLDSLIEDLLVFARVGSDDTVSEPVDLNEVVRDAVSLLPSGDAHVTWTSLPTVTGHRHQLGQLVQNLVANACKFVASGTIPTVRVSADRDADGWRLSVSDNGVGVDPAHREDIFEMFRRLQPRERYEGTGIGLAICKRIVEGHGGRIWVEGNPSGGSVFRFSVPDPAAPAVEGLPSEAGSPGEQPLTDPVTGLPNLAELRYRAEQALARAARTEEAVCLLWITLDVSEGASMADIGRCIRQLVRPPDTVGRVGTSDFAVLCVGLTSREDAAALQARLAAAVELAGVGIGGISLATSDGNVTADELLARARQGSNR